MLSTLSKNCSSLLNLLMDLPKLSKSFLLKEGKLGIIYAFIHHCKMVGFSLFPKRVKPNTQTHLIHKSIYADMISILENFEHILINLFEFFQHAKRQIIQSFECIWIYLLAIWESRLCGVVIKLVGTSKFKTID